ncbi:MAG: hypothetical protein JXR78_13295 [Victivallales bacterium]|nr:hypothetical protein [Victivallales bacterium]
MLKNNKTELCWSFFHSMEHNLDHFKRILAEADKYNVESFEVCVELPIYGLDLFIDYEDYPLISEHIDVKLAQKMRNMLNEIVKMSHASGRRITLWHREVVIPEEMSKYYPELFDSKGEIDFSKNEYFKLLKSKIAEFFKHVPGIDGIVLTLTEANYSVINTRQPDKYPPIDTAAKIVKVFAEEMEKTNKTLTFRTFGSLKSDYQTLSKVADIVLQNHRLEIETKVTPYDWSIVQPNNQFLKKRPNSGLAAEFDSLGEFYGLGEIPCMIPDLQLQWLDSARSKDVNRICVRVDRRGRQTLDSLNKINLFAISQSLKNPNIKAEEIWIEWMEENFKEVAGELLPVFTLTKEICKKMYYIDGHMLTQRLTPDFKSIMLGATPAILEENISLEFADGLWSVLSDKHSPSREFVLNEKQEACRMTEECYRKVVEFRDKIPEQLRELTCNSFLKLVYISQFMNECVKILYAYLDDIRDASNSPERLKQAIDNSLNVAERVCKDFNSGLIKDFVDCIKQNGVVFPEWYYAELKVINDINTNYDVSDLVITGGVSYEWRIRRYMHASELMLKDGYPVRSAGTKLFPNGFLELELAAPKAKNHSLLVVLHSDGGAAQITANGKSVTVSPGTTGFCFKKVNIPVCGDKFEIKIESTDNRPPLIAGIASIK